MLQRPGQLRLRQLQQRCISPLADAKIPKAQGKQRLLRPLDPGKILCRDPHSGLDSGSLAGIGRLVPDRQARRLRPGTDLRLRQAAQPQR